MAGPTANRQTTKNDEAATQPTDIDAINALTDHKVGEKALHCSASVPYLCVLVADLSDVSMCVHEDRMSVAADHDLTIRAAHRHTGTETPPVHLTATPPPSLLSRQGSERLSGWCLLCFPFFSLPATVYRALTGHRGSVGSRRRPPCAQCGRRIGAAASA